MATLSAHDELTPRERQTLGCMLIGLTAKEAARTMGCGSRTVEDYRRNVLKKYKARNAVELVRAFYGLDTVDAEATSRAPRTLARG